MNDQIRAISSSAILEVDTDLLGKYADRLAKSLDKEMRRVFHPNDRKTLRKFSAGEFTEYTGINASTARARHKDGSFPEVETDGRGHRLYSAEEMDAIRQIMIQTGKNGEEYRAGRRDGDPMQIISVVNFKGGSGKTTATAHIANYLTLRGFRTLVVDMDPQASLSTFFGYRPELDFDSPDELTIYDALCYEDAEQGIRRAGLREVIRKTYFHNLDIAPASLELAEYETTTAYALSTNAMRKTSHTIFAARLAEKLAEVQDDYDIVLIDCPPQLGFTTLTAITASTGLLVTVVPGMLDIASMSQFLKLATDTMEAIRGKSSKVHSWSFVKFLVTRFEPADGPQNQMAGYLRHLLGSQVLINPMLKSTAFSDAGMAHQTLYEVDPKQLVKSTLDRAIGSMNAVGREIEGIIHRVWGR